VGSSVDLYLYGASNGVISDIAVNHSDSQYNDVYAVGAFDSVSELSQLQFCSVGEWDGVIFDKVRLHVETGATAVTPL
jgi:hypothetical protein